MNAEVVLGTVQNAREACRWLAYTYLYVRMLRNPQLYGISPEDAERDFVLEDQRADLVWKWNLLDDVQYRSSTVSV